MKELGFTRKEIRGGSGVGEGTAGDHFNEMVGSIELNIYRHPARQIKGYEALKADLESNACEVTKLSDTSNPVGPRYETIKISNGGNEISVPLLKRAHNWAHQRNLLHMFYKNR